MRIGGEGPRADACRAAYLHLLASTPRTRRLDAPLLEEGALRRACDALTDQADARILSVLMDLAPKAPSDEALPASVARAASMLVQTLPIEIQGEKMDDSSDSDDDARRGTLLLADALSDAFAARDRRAPRGSIDLASVARPFLCLALRQGYYFIRSGESGRGLWFRGARAVRDGTSSTRQGDGAASARGGGLRRGGLLPRKGCGRESAVRGG